MGARHQQGRGRGQQQGKNPVVKPVSKKSEPKQRNSNNLLWMAGILLLTFIVFVPILSNALTNWDDPHYLNDNPLIKKLNTENIKRIFTEVFFGNYQPLHILSYAIEYNFYKLNPAGYHATSLIMHLVVTWLVYRFIFLLSENVTIALIAALLFGIHPMHVESVAWAAERKDVLYAMFFLGSLNLYIRYIKEGQKMKYLVYAVLLFALSIMSKAMASSLPPVLILLDYYYGRKFSTKVVLEKIPFFILALIFGFIATHTVSTTGQVSLNAFSLFERIMFANMNLLSYVGKLILPVQLSAFYPYPHRIDGHLPYYYYIAPVIVIALLVLILRSAKKTKVYIFGAGFFVANVILVLQLFPVGPTIMSERYSYMSSIGFFFVVAWLLYQLVLKRPAMKNAVIGGLAVYCLFLSVSTYARSKVWKDSITLWSNVLEQFPNVGVALNNRGNIYGKEMGDLDRAMADFNRSVQFDPTYENAYVNRGIVFCMRSQFENAIADFNKALELKPDYFDARFNRGIAYTQTNQVDKAIADFTFLIKDNKDDSRIFMSRGRSYSQVKRYDEALADLNRAIELNPEYPEAYYNRASVHYNKGMYKEAYADVMEASNLGYKVEQSFFETIKKAAGNTP